MITFLYYSLIAFVAFFIVAHIYYRSKDRIAPLGIGGADFVRLTIEIFKDISSLVKKIRRRKNDGRKMDE